MPLKYAQPTTLPDSHLQRNTQDAPMAGELANKRQRAVMRGGHNEQPQQPQRGDFVALQTSTLQRLQSIKALRNASSASSWF